MVSDAVLGALVGGGAAVAGSFVQAYFSRRNMQDQIEAQTKRLRAELPLQKRNEDLTTLHSHLAECYEEFGQILSHREQGGQIDVSENEYQNNLYPLIKAYQEAITVSSIHLTLEQRQTLVDARSQIFSAASLIKQESPDLDYSPDIEEMGPEEASWVKLTRSCERAMAMLREEFNEPIDELEPDTAQND